MFCTQSHKHTYILCYQHKSDASASFSSFCLYYFASGGPSRFRRVIGRVAGDVVIIVGVIVNNLLLALFYDMCCVWKFKMQNTFWRRVFKCLSGCRYMSIPYDSIYSHKCVLMYVCKTSSYTDKVLLCL